LKSKAVVIALVFSLLIAGISTAYAVFPEVQETVQNFEIWANNLGRKPDDPYYLTMNYRLRRLYLAITAFNKKDPVVFFGDSITFGANWQQLFPKTTVVNRGISGDTTLGLLNRQSEIIALHPHQVFLMIGTNDLCFERPLAQILENYRLILERFQQELPGTPVYVQSVLPFNDKLFPSRGLRKNEYIRALNNGIKQLAEEFDYRYIDLTTAFTAPDGRLMPEYTYDGLHLNDKAYQVWRNLINPLVVKR